MIPNLGDAADWDRYVYVRNNPFRYNDPSGHDPESILDWMMGASYQFSNDMTYGLVDDVAAAFGAVCMDCNASPAYRQGQQAGRVASVTAATASTVFGAKAIVDGLLALGTTAGVGTGCAALTGGACAAPAGAALAAEAVVVATGTAAVTYGSGVVAFTNGNPVGDNEPQVVQTGGHTLTDRTLKALGLTKEQGKAAIERLKKFSGYGNDFHGKILSDGTVIDPKTEEIIGNIFDFLP